MKPTKAPTKFRIVRALTRRGLIEPPDTMSVLAAGMPLIDLRASTMMQIVGIDAATFAFDASAVPPVVAFPSLPKRDNTRNPLQTTQSPRDVFTVQTKDFLIFLALIQGYTSPPGVTLSAQPQAQVVGTGALIPGPFLGSNSFKGFQATLQMNSANGAVSGAISGSVVGMLFLSVG